MPKKLITIHDYILSGVVDSRLLRVPNSPTGQVLEAGPGWPVLGMAMTGPD